MNYKGTATPGYSPLISLKLIHLVFHTPSGRFHRLHFLSNMLFLRPYMAINVEVEKNSNESSANVIRRFTKRMQGAGIVPKVRGGRYYTRNKSGNVRRAAKLKKLDKAEAYEKLVKLGVVQEHRGRGRR